MKSHLCLSAIFAMTLLRAAAEPNPVEATMFPPEFLFSQREALGLDETQLQALKAVVEDAQPRFEALKGPMQEKSTALQAALQQAKPDLDQTVEKLREVLKQEAEIKTLQLRTMLALRNSLTEAQFEKARQLKQQMMQAAGNNDPHMGLPERLGKKFEQLKTAMQERAFEGAPPEEIVKQVGEIQHLAQEGQPLEAERRIDLLIIQLREGKTKR
jgi:Spy/CpxP family protein refolding chaperone